MLQSILKYPSFFESPGCKYRKKRRREKRVQSVENAFTESRESIMALCGKKLGIHFVVNRS